MMILGRPGVNAWTSAQSTDKAVLEEATARREAERKTAKFTTHVHLSCESAVAGIKGLVLREDWTPKPVHIECTGAGMPSITDWLEIPSLTDWRKQTLQLQARRQCRRSWTNFVVSLTAVRGRRFSGSTKERCASRCR